MTDAYTLRPGDPALVRSGLVVFPGEGGPSFMLPGAAEALTLRPNVEIALCRPVPSIGESMY